MAQRRTVERSVAKRSRRCNSLATRLYEAGGSVLRSFWASASAAGDHLGWREPPLLCGCQDAAAPLAKARKYEARSR